MNWEEIKLNRDNTAYIFNGKNIFNRTFLDALEFMPPGVAAVKDETGSYHINTEGEKLYGHRFDRTFGFYFNRAAVVRANEWFHISLAGDRAYRHSYAWTGNFQEQLCTVRDRSNNYFHIDINGNRIYKENYCYAGDYKDGLGCVRVESGLFKHINTEGRDLNGKLFVDLGVFHKNYATARDSIGWFHINKDGEQLYKERFRMVEPFYNGSAFVETNSKKKIIIDEGGNTILGESI